MVTTTPHASSRHNGEKTTCLREIKGSQASPFGWYTLNMHFQRPRVAAALLACIAILALGYAAVRKHHSVHAVRTGDAAPVMEVSDLRGAPVRLQSNRGITVYNVFTSWCPSCKEETPMLARAASGLRARGVHLIGIDQGESPEVVASFADRYGLTYPIMVDTSHVTNALLGARVIPETVVVKDGIVKAIAVGPLTIDQLHELIGTV